MSQGPRHRRSPRSPSAQPHEERREQPAAKRRRVEPLLTRRAGLDQLEGRNVVMEGFRGGRSFVEILLDQGATPKGVLGELLALAGEQRVPVRQVARQALDTASLTGAHQGIIAWSQPREGLTLATLLDDLQDRDEEPFLLLMDEVQYEQNLGAILRTAEAAGVNGVIVPRSHSVQLTPVVRKISAGASEHVPLVRESPMSALKALQRAGILRVGADEHAPRGFDEVDLTGPVALVMGGEHKGLTPPVRERCDLLVSLPMRGRIPSLNVSVAAALLLYEKVRQERAAARARAEAATEP